MIPKRFGTIKVTFDFKMVQKLRINVRKKSLEIWKDTLNAKIFDKNLNSYIILLKTFTRLNHVKKRLAKILE